MPGERGGKGEGCERQWEDRDLRKRHRRTKSYNCKGSCSTQTNKLAEIVGGSGRGGAAGGDLEKGVGLLVDLGLLCVRVPSELAGEGGHRVARA